MWHKTRHVADGGGNWRGLADSAGLYYNVVEFLHCDYVVQLRYKVHLKGAADASVLQRHKALVFCANYAALLYKVGIYVYLSNVVYNYRKADALRIGKNMIKKCCLPASQITGEQ